MLRGADLLDGQQRRTDRKCMVDDARGVVGVDERQAVAPQRPDRETSARLEPPSAGPVLPLQRLGDRQWGTPWTVRPPPGQWFLQFRLRLTDGRHVFGPRVAIRVQ